MELLDLAKITYLFENTFGKFASNTAQLHCTFSEVERPTPYVGNRYKANIGNNDNFEMMLSAPTIETLVDRCNNIIKTLDWLK